MELTLPEVARVFDVSENMVSGWVQQENLPAHQVNFQYRFNRVELLEWAVLRKKKFSPDIFQEINGDHVAELSLADAIERGGVAMQVQGANRTEVYTAALREMSVPEGFDRANLLQLLLAREKSGGTTMGDGIAIPHPRYPVILPSSGSAVRICYLQQPLDFQAADGQPVDTLFFMICPTVHEHLQLLARLASILGRDNFRKLLADRPDKTRLLSAIRAEEQAFLESTDSVSG